MKIRILDDHPIITNALEQLLIKEFPKAEIYQSTQLEENIEKYEITILDLNFFGKTSGYEFLEKHYPYSNYWIIFSMHAEKVYIEKAIQLGAHAYVVKSDHPEEMIQAIHSLSLQKNFFSKSAKKALENTDKKINLTLSDREQQIAQMVIQGLNSKKIASLLKISPRTVETHRQNMMKRLGVTNSAQLTQTLLHYNIIQI